MSVAVNTTILRRRDTTETWEYVNPILADREQGFETDIYGLPVGMKMGNGVSHWDDLPYWFTPGFTPPIAPPINISAGTPSPYFIDISLYPGFDKNAMFIYKVPLDADTNRRFDDFTMDEIYYGGTLLGFNFYGHDDGSGNFAEDCIIQMKP